MAKENQFRIEIAEMIDQELRSASSLKQVLKKELSLQETMQERVIVRNELREVTEKIKDLEQAKQDQGNILHDEFYN